jgi:hypothetical protein
MGKKKRKKPNPVYLRGLEEGRKQGEQEALDKIYTYIKERVMTIGEIEGIGEKTVWKIHQHLLDGVEGEKE